MRFAPLAAALLVCVSSCPAAAADPGLLDEWGSLGAGPGQWTSPVRITATEPGWGPDELIVVDASAARVQRFDPAGTLVAEWRPDNSTLVGPVACVYVPQTDLDSSPRYAVLDLGRDEVVLLDASGAEQRSFPVSPAADGDIACFGWGGPFLVLLREQHALYAYGLDGTLQQTWGTPGVAGSAVGEFSSPQGVAALWEGGLVAVADTGNDRVIAFNVYTGAVSLHAFGSSGTGDGQFAGPQGLAFDCRGGLVVADTQNHRVQRLFVEYEGPMAFAEVWFAEGTEEVRDLVYPLAQGTIVGKESPALAEKRSTIGGDLFVLGEQSVRHYEPECCPGGWIFFESSWARSDGGNVYVSPRGTGPSLASVGATVEVYLDAGCGDSAIANYPFQDIWLDDAGDGGLALCTGGSVADANTGADGRTTISGSLFAGGATAAMLVYIAGSALSSDPLDIQAVSPDMNGDLRVDLQDIAAFAATYFGVYDSRADFDFNGVLNLGDIGILALENGATCP